MAVDVSQLVFQTGLAGVGARQEYADHIRSGDSVGSAGFKTGASFLSNATLSIPGAIAFGVGTALAIPTVNAISRGIIGRNNKIHSMAIPFSQQFHHNQMTAHLQSYGLSHMGSSGMLGNEAATMYGRYGR